MVRHEESVDQIVFRWDAGNTLGTTGFGPVAWSCGQETAGEFFRRAAALLRSTAAETVPALIRLEKAGQTLLVHRAPWPDPRGQRSSTVCHALLGPSAILDAELCLGLSRWSWAGSGLALGDVRGSLEAVRPSALLPSADDGQRRLLAGLPEARETLTAVAAEFLRNPGQAFTVLDREGGDSACRVLWGLHGIFSEVHPRGWTFATHDTVEDRAIRFLFVRSWPGTVSRSTDRTRTDPRERLADRAERVAAGLVDRYLRRVEEGEGHEYEVAKALAAAAGGGAGGPGPRGPAGAGGGRDLLAAAERALTLLTRAPDGPRRPSAPRGSYGGGDGSGGGPSGGAGGLRGESAWSGEGLRRGGGGAPAGYGARGGPGSGDGAGSRAGHSAGAGDTRVSADAEAPGGGGGSYGAGGGDGPRSGYGAGAPAGTGGAYGPGDEAYGSDGPRGGGGAYGRNGAGEPAGGRTQESGRAPAGSYGTTRREPPVPLRAQERDEPYDQYRGLDPRRLDTEPRTDAGNPDPVHPGRAGRPEPARPGRADPRMPGRRPDRVEPGSGGPGSGDPRSGDPRSVEPGSGDHPGSVEPRAVKPDSAPAESRQSGLPAGLERVGGERAVRPDSVPRDSAGPGPAREEAVDPGAGWRAAARQEAPASPAKTSASGAHTPRRPAPERPPGAAPFTPEPSAPEPFTAGPRASGPRAPEPREPGPFTAGPRAPEPQATAAHATWPSRPPSEPETAAAEGPGGLPRVRPEWPAAPRPGRLIHRRQKRTVDYPQLLTALRLMEEEPDGARRAEAAAAGTTDKHLVMALRQEHIPYAAVGLLVREIADRYSEWGRAPRRELCETVLDMGLFVTSRPRPAAGPPPADETRAANAAALYHWAVRPLARDERISGRLAAVLPRLALGADLAGRAAVDRILEQKNGPGLGDAVWLALLRALRQDRATESPGFAPAPVAVPGPARSPAPPPPPPLSPPRESTERGRSRIAEHTSPPPLAPPAFPPSGAIPGPGSRYGGDTFGTAEGKDARVLVLSVVGACALALTVLVYLLLAG
ncbi:hypothetical protein [Streptomyces albus]|uniref:hypothetical protein n=1 Tax=Streptomyces albus TaxID=1888 RepID=UPI0004C72A35|nr:hypothetical protein [Streptomyces albus]